MAKPSLSVKEELNQLLDSATDKTSLQQIGVKINEAMANHKLTLIQYCQLQEGLAHLYEPFWSESDNDFDDDPWDL